MAFLDETGLAELWSLISAADSSVEASANAKAKIAIGSYAGTEKCGTSNKNSLTFDFTPKVVLIVCDSTSYIVPDVVYVWGSSVFTYVSMESKHSTVSVSGNTMTWYSSSANLQMNKSGATYRYVAIG
jgi:hypothetical protein